MANQLLSSFASTKRKYIDDLWMILEILSWVRLEYTSRFWPNFEHLYIMAAFNGAAIL